MRIKFTVILFCFFTQICNGQTPSQKHSGAGDNVARDKIVNNYYNLNRNKAVILKINKYIDLNRPVLIFIGGNYTRLSSLTLEKGFDISQILPLKEKNVFTLSIKNNNLTVSVDINDFDLKNIGRIRENKLLPTTNYYITATDSSLELYDEYFNTLFQIGLFRLYNCIYIGGVINYSSGYFIINNDNITYNDFKKKLHMRPSERDSTLSDYLEAVKEVMPLSESHKNISLSLKKNQIETQSKRQVYLESVANDLCACVMNKKNKINTKSQYSEIAGACLKKISKITIQKLFIELKENIETKEGWKRVKEKVIFYQANNCKGFALLLEKLADDKK